MGRVLCQGLRPVAEALSAVVSRQILVLRIVPEKNVAQMDVVEAVVPVVVIRKFALMGVSADVCRKNQRVVEHHS